MLEERYLADQEQATQLGRGQITEDLQIDFIRQHEFVLQASFI
jgi:hypothetical protein